MPIRLVAVDLDGTLLNSRSEISPANRNALVAAHERGVLVVVVTGRRFHSARPFLLQIPFPVTAISSNGARIGSISGDAYYRDFLPFPVARDVLGATREFRPYAVAIFDVPGRGQLVMQEGAVSEGPLGWYMKSSPDFLSQVADLEAAIASNPIQIMFGGPPAQIEPIETLLAASFIKSKIHLTWTKYLSRNVALLDVMNRSCSKGAALKLWAERCGLRRSEILAIGDNYNDLEMLEFAGQPVLMENCCSGMAREGWPVTPSNDQDGVAAAIDRYVLNAER